MAFADGFSAAALLAVVIAAIAFILTFAFVRTQVWAALRAIPSGETRTYGALAETLPVPATAQEVGAVCAACQIFTPFSSVAEQPSVRPAL
jgi:6-O-methylguanine DNA methyltransferase, DNA binding domain